MSPPSCRFHRKPHEPAVRRLGSALWPSPATIFVSWESRSRRDIPLPVRRSRRRSLSTRRSSTATSAAVTRWATSLRSEDGSDSEQIIGVIRNTAQIDLDKPAEPELYLSFEQTLLTPFLTGLVVRTDASAPETISGSARGTVRGRSTPARGQSTNTRSPGRRQHYSEPFLCLDSGNVCRGCIATCECRHLWCGSLRHCGAPPGFWHPAVSRLYARRNISAGYRPGAPASSDRRFRRIRESPI